MPLFLVESCDYHKNVIYGSCASFMKNLTRTERLILRKIENEEFVLTIHAVRRMKERCISSFDIINSAKTANSISWQRRHGTFLICGEDLDGETLFYRC